MSLRRPFSSHFNLVAATLKSNFSAASIFFLAHHPRSGEDAIHASRNSPVSQWVLCVYLRHHAEPTRKARSIHWGAGQCLTGSGTHFHREGCL